ncbi:MAG: aminotransferase class I/II-fold pyridoxal phosphate-dependent enzyme, partial [Deltaproteobacteria bacterium]|nr:aminotransferase class I/II-fold pyridoxal phosphate-dependent enzyme [Deltaproteobacteria bacterium]
MPLTDELDLDVDGIISIVTKKLDENPNWNKNGAVVFNNPHNASGQVFAEEKLAHLIKWLLERDIFIIDDLSYQNVAPAKKLSGVKTIQQITLDLVKNGYVNAEKRKFVFTMHSLSKTDCFAGARLAVAHIPHPEVKEKFAAQIEKIKPNIMATLIAYLFYRNRSEYVSSFWLLRNQIFFERMKALNDAQENLP